MAKAGVCMAGEDWTGRDGEPRRRTHHHHNRLHFTYWDGVKWSVEGLGHMLVALLAGPPLEFYYFRVPVGLNGSMPPGSLRRAAFLQISPAQLMNMGTKLYSFCLHWLLCSLLLISGSHGVTNTEITIFNDPNCGTFLDQLIPNTANDCENTLGGSQSFRIERVDAGCSRMSLAART